MSAAIESPQKYVLGLDLGSASLGWALIALDQGDDPTSLIRTGVRIFEPGVDGTSLDIQQGKDQSKAVDRRTARLHRRQLRRRAARHRELFLELQTAGLLPLVEGRTGASSEQRHEILNELDQALGEKFSLSRDDAAFAQMPLYLLRKRALDYPLEAFELGVFSFISSSAAASSPTARKQKRAPRRMKIRDRSKRIFTRWNWRSRHLGPAHSANTSLASTRTHRRFADAGLHARCL